MANEYATIGLLKSSLKITDTDRDELLTQALSAASRGLDRTTGRRFYLDATATQRIYNPRGRVTCGEFGERFIVDDFGSLTGLIVEVGSGDAWIGITDYETTPDNALVRGLPVTGLLRPSGGWASSRAGRVRVTARWGWPAIPDEVVQATLIQAGRLYKRKDSVEGILGSAEWGVVRLSRVDPDVQALVQHLVLPGFG